FDTVAQAASGFLRLLVNPDHPRVVGPAIADAVTGMYAAQGLLAALHERHSTDKGRLVEISMFEAMCHFNLDDFTHLLSAQEIMGPYSRPHVSQSYVLECADGKWIALHMSSPPKFWENLASAVGRPDMLSLPSFASRDARISHYDDVIAFLAPIFATRERSHWETELTRLEVPNAAVRTSKDVLDSPQAQAVGLCVEDPDGPFGPFRTIRSPLIFDGERMDRVTAPPTLGQHDEEFIAVLKA
ncbi:MAG: CoA transferase, partial [Sphingorhabdus sp.]|nr:CoA transferase [Sphingorhabdus sp.]